MNDQFRVTFRFEDGQRQRRVLRGLSLGGVTSHARLPTNRPPTHPGRDAHRRVPERRWASTQVRGAHGRMRMPLTRLNADRRMASVASAQTRRGAWPTCSAPTPQFCDERCRSTGTSGTLAARERGVSPDLTPAPLVVPPMGLPLIVPREAHTLSRRDVDPDALKVLYRLKDAGFKAYIVGGGVRDLLLGRRPKDFDIGTDAHPYQIKKLFRNCFIIGRRFRLAHIRFGTKVIEVATFRRQVTEEEQAEAEARAAAEAGAGAEGGGEAGHGPHDHLVHRDNTFGTPEEDAFRRDFTLNALFYDIATFSIIDYVGGLEDLRARRRAVNRGSRRPLPRGPRPDAAGGVVRRASRLHDRPARGRRDRERAPADRAGRARAAGGGVLQDSPIGRLRAHVPGTAPPRPARAPERGPARPRARDAVGVAGQARRVPAARRRRRRPR